MAGRLPRAVRRPLARALRSRPVTNLRGAPGLVLAYHRVADVPRDPFGLCVRPERFAEHLSLLPDLADVVPISEVGLGRSGDRRRVAITFDDGYADLVDVAAPLLRERGLHATFFLATAGLDPESEFWWDRLEHMILDAPGDTEPARIRIGGDAHPVDTRSAPSRSVSLRDVNRALRKRSPEEIEAALASLAEMVGGWDGACEHHRRLAPGRARELLSAGEVGAHTRTHPLLPMLDDASASAEIRGSRDDVARLVGAPARSFAYPFGMRGSFDRRTVRMVREAGFDAAFVNVPGLVRRGTNRFMIPRVAVGDVGGAMFAECVERWYKEM